MSLSHLPRIGSKNALRIGLFTSFFACSGHPSAPVIAPSLQQDKTVPDSSEDKVAGDNATGVPANTDSGTDQAKAVAGNKETSADPGNSTDETDNLTDIERIHKRLFDLTLATQSPTSAATKTLLDTLQADGSWSGVNYKDRSITNWIPLKHVTNVLTMALAYRQKDSGYFESEALKSSIILALEYYQKAKPISDNWYYNSIAGPRSYADALMVMKGAIPDDKMKSLSAYLVDRMEQYKTDGDNLLAVAAITLRKADVEKDEALMKSTFKGAGAFLAVFASVKAPALGDVGIKADFSFHQHRQQLFMGGYGVSFVSKNLEMMELASGTAFASEFSAEKRKLFSDMALQGFQSIGYRGRADFGAIGRYISRPKGMSGLGETIIDKLKTYVAPDQASAYDAWKSHIKGGPAAISGNRYFWNSSIMVQNASDSYLSAKIISKRSIGTEFLNGENLKFYYLPFGATNIMTSGNEYYDIFPVWDWSRIPGTTAEMDPELPAFQSAEKNPEYADGLISGAGYITGKNAFAGGVSNGKSGIISFEQNYLGVAAKKSYFFINGMMVCLGNSIKGSKSNIIATNLNQALRSGPVTVSSQAGVHTYTETEFQQELQEVKWVHHDNVGYIFQGGIASVQSKKQEGSWASINTSQNSTAVAKGVFSLWINHSQKPSGRSYFYIVAPHKTAAETETLAQQHGFVVTQNNADVQALRSDKSNSYGIIFFAAGSADLGDGLSVVSDKKAIVLIEKQADDTYQVSVADPLYTEAQITLTLTKTTTKNSYAEKKSMKKTFTLPSGEYQGSTSTNVITLQ